MVSVQQNPALKEGRIDIGFGRLRHSDPSVTGIVLREERLVVAIPKDTPLAEGDTPLPVAALAGRKIIVCPKDPRPSYADQVLSLLQGTTPGPPRFTRSVKSRPRSVSSPRMEAYASSLPPPARCAPTYTIG